MLKGIKNQFERLLQNIGNLSIKKKDYNGFEHIQYMKTRVHKIITKKLQNKKPYYLWRLPRHQRIQQTDKAKISIYPIFPVLTLFHSNQKLEEMLFFIEKKVKCKSNGIRKSPFCNT